MLRRLSRMRVLAIDPTARGFGYSVLEGSERLIEWSLVETRSESAYHAKVEALLARYEPRVLIVEDPKGSRRGERARARINLAQACARARKIEMRKVTRLQVRRIFSESGTAKWDIALAISRWFPELEDQLPRKRRIWESEERRMAIFNAISFALTLMWEEERSSTASSENN